MSDRYAEDSRYTVAAYFDLVKQGVLDEDDRVELLEGVIVAEPAMDPPHATGIGLVAEALRNAIGTRAHIRVQTPYIVQPYSAPEPDVAVVPGNVHDYWDHHPTTALLVVEVSDSSLKQDRLSKSRIYAGSGIPDYWVVNLRDDCVELFRAPDPTRRLYGERRTAHRGERITLTALPDVSVAVDDLLPLHRSRPEY